MISRGCVRPTVAPMAFIRAAFIVAVTALVAAAERATAQVGLRLNQIQGKGTHNSYHLQPAVSMHPSHRYSHVSLTRQLSEQGVRCFELDVHQRRGGDLEVFHLPVIDQRSTCKTLKDALIELRRWSDGHPKHVPLMVWIEPKDDLPKYSSSFGAVHWRKVEGVIGSVWPDDRILRPDDVRGEHGDLPTAISAGGWPLLSAVRGKVVFALLDGGVHRRAYLEDAPNLARRRMFVLSDDPAAAHAAVFKIDDARRHGGQIRRLVKRGFLVSTNCDRAGVSPEDNAARLRRSLGVGSHFPVATKAGGGYACTIPGAFVRVNPVSGPEERRGQPVLEPGN